MSADCRIVICHRRWVFVGFVTREEGSAGAEIVIRRAKNLRRWGTKHGLGELFTGPKSETVLDEAGTVRLHPLAVIAQLEIDPKAWAKHLAP